MEFKRPLIKRYSECTFESPKNRKKSKLLSTTIASPSASRSTAKAINYFDDNFSQMFTSQQFQTQFTRQTSSSTHNLNETLDRAVDDVKFGGYNFTQTGFSQIIGSSQFEKSLSSGQRIRSSQTIPADSSNAQIVQPFELPADNEEPDPFDEQIVQSSQIFLNEVTALHLNISSMIDETLNANKTLGIDEQFDTSKFEAYKSEITLSDYVQIKRPSQQANRTNFNHSDDQILAEFVDNEANVSEALNDAIDPDSSALQALLNDIEDDVVNSSITENTESNERRQSENFQQNRRTSTINPFKPVSSSNFSCMGPFFDLPEKVRKLIKEYKQIDDLYDWQKECLQLPSISLRHNLIYALPTSGGKTLVSEILIFREILCRQKNCLFILPYVSIVQEKVWALSPFALQLDFLIEEYAAGKGSLPPRQRRKKRSVYIATIEKALAMIDSLIENDRIQEIGLIIVDELHIIGEAGRGAVMEALLTKVQHLQASIQIVGMSATIGNLPELAEFLDADIYHKDFRPVELREFIKCGADLLEIKKDAADLESAFVRDRSVSFGYSDELQRMDPDHIGGLVSEVIPEKSCLIFCSTKKNCENLSSLLCNILPSKYTLHRIIERKNLIKAIENDIGSAICPILGKTIHCGIAYHHSGLTTDERRHLEDAFRLGVLCVICCTSTLAAGVNLPAKRVIIRSPYVGKSFITLSKYKQMVGRAGRAGFGENGESILICTARDNQQVTQLLCSPMDEVISQMATANSTALDTLILSSIGLNIANTRTELQKVLKKTLYSAQSQRLGYDTVKTTDDIISKLLKAKSITLDANQTDKSRAGVTNADELARSQTENHSFHQEIPLSQKTIILKPSTKLVVSAYGKSSFKSGIDLNRSKIVHKELQQAQRSLVLLDYFHLLYIVTPFDDNNTNVMPDRAIFYNKYNGLTDLESHTARIIGINENVAFKMMSGRTLKAEEERIVKKFFLTMILNELWHLKPIPEIAITFKVDRGLVQNLMGMAAVEASCLLKFCEEMETFWAFRELFKNLSQRLSNICTVELVPLMQLPCVKMGRAKQLYAAGYRKVEDIAKAKANDLVSKIEHLSTRVANQLISAAKVMVLEKLENLRDEVQDCLDIYSA